jgi:hypothetical protein
MLHKTVVVVTIMTPEPVTPDAAEVEVLELLEPMTVSSHSFNASSVHVVCVEEAQ